MCSGREESLKHLMFECPFATHVYYVRKSITSRAAFIFFAEVDWIWVHRDGRSRKLGFIWLLLCIKFEHNGNARKKKKQAPLLSFTRHKYRMIVFDLYIFPQ